jgi:hypothetical protein
MKQTQRDKYLQRVYGITEKQYSSLLKKQDYSCAVCKKPKSAEKKSLAVDHDHKTMQIRGLLCTFCNRRVIGRHRDPLLFFAAYEYLMGGTGWFVPVKKKKKRKKKK